MKYVVVVAKRFDKRLAQEMADRGDWNPLRDYLVESAEEAGRYPSAMIEAAVDRAIQRMQGPGSLKAALNAFEMAYAK